MKYSIQKLDKDSSFRYAIEFKCSNGVLPVSPSGVKNLNEVRRWLTGAYGVSDHVSECVSRATNDYWTWKVNTETHAIYLRDGEELMMFRLRFPIEDVG